MHVVQKYVFCVFGQLSLMQFFGVKELDLAHRDVRNDFKTPFLTLVDTLIYKNKNRDFTCV